MRTIKYLAVGAAAIGLPLSLVLAPIQSTGAAAPGGPSVTVDNTSANPVPVIGTLGAVQGGAWNVAVSNLPATQPVSGTVGLDQGQNSVKLDPFANATTEANSIAKSPFRLVNFGAFGSGNPGAFNAHVSLGTVPSHARFITTYASVEIFVPAGHKVLIELTAGGVGTRFPAIDQGVFGGQQVFVGAQQMSVAFEPGEEVVVRAHRSHGDGDNVGQVVGWVQGFLVPVF